jgi:hypothetical protein
MMEQAPLKMFRKWSGARQTAISSVALFGLNAAIAWPLARAEYLDNLQSNEGAFMSIARFLLEHWPRVAWFPWFNGGTPLEKAYFPLVPALTAAIAWVGRCGPAHGLHLLAALEFSLGPVFLFLFARKVSGRLAPSLAAALVWSLLSPAALVPQIRHEMGTLWGLRRLHTVVYYGELPHNLAVSLLPLAWWLMARFWERPCARRFAPAVLVTAALLLSNAFGVTVAIISSAMLLVSLDKCGWQRVISTAGVLLTAYLLICRFLPPSLLREVGAAAPTLGGDYRATPGSLAIGALLVAALAVLWFAMRRCESVLRFAALFTVCFGGIAVLWYTGGIALLPSAHRYILEAEAGASVALAFALARWLRPEALILALALVVMDWRFAHHWIHPIDIAQSVAYRQARWIGTNLPGERVMVSGENEFWFNLFADNPQLAAGHEGAANWVERVAVYTIYSGHNAGARDAAISVEWLKTFGCGAITVPGPQSRDYFHPFRNPYKFEGLLPLVWRDNDDFIYRVPLRSPGLAHVIPAEALVTARPVHGLDVGPLSRYVAALEDPAIPAATLAWQNAERGRIVATVNPGQVVSVEITYDPGWRAWVAGRPALLHPDGLGFITIEPQCRGDCIVDLRFDGGAERRICAVLGILVALALTIGLLLPGRVPNR